MNEIRKKCVVSGCGNYADEGGFRGSACAPCYEYLTTGDVGPTTSFLSDVSKFRAMQKEARLILDKSAEIESLDTGHVLEFLNWIIGSEEGGS